MYLTGCYILVVNGLLLISYPDVANSQQQAVATTWSTASPRSEFQWMARLTIRYRNFPTFICSASLVHPQWLLTAAHCLKNDNDTATSVIAKIGLYDLWADEFGRERDVIVVQRSSSRYVFHPKYNRTRSWEFNMALIRLSQPITTLRVLQIPYSISMCSSNYTSTTFPVDTCDAVTTVGWTPNKPRDTENPLKRGSFAMQTFGYCLRTGRADDGSFSVSKICAPANEGMSGCVGDSGAPLICRSRLDGRNYVIGVAAFGRRGECNLPDGMMYPDFHARVCSDYLWLYMTINGLQQEPPKTTCGQPPWILNGLLNQGSNAAGSVRSITCFNGTYIVGSRTISCGDDGKWSPFPTPKCLKEIPNY